MHNDFANPVVDTGAPANAAELFAAADVGAMGPCMYEPESGTLFPNNWIRPRFRFTTTQQENLFEIKLVIPNETSPLVVYTTQNPYTVDAAVWQTMTSAGSSAPIAVTIRSAVVTAGALTGGPWTGTTGTIEIAPVPVSGDVVYWTTTGNLLKGFQLGSESAPQLVVSAPQVDTQCIGCHTSTPDGLYVGMTASPNPNTADQVGFIDVVSVDGGASPPAFLSPSALTLLQRPNQQVPSFSLGHWTTGDHIALSEMPVNGTYEIIWTNLEATSNTQGTAWGVVTRTGDTTNAAGTASFSHDGNNIVYTSAPTINSGVNSTSGGISIVPYNGGQGGTATSIMGANDPTYLQYYPSFSHDDRFVAFNRAPLPAGGAGNSYNNPDAEVLIVPAAGGTATRLAANDPPACLGVTSPGITNSWAKWSPEVLSVCGNTYYFLVFSSTRDPMAANTPQLYVAPIVIDATGKITTYSALYFWNQPENEHNHTPAWDVFKLPPPPPPPK
jgi:hypothetical protein